MTKTATSTRAAAAVQADNGDVVTQSDLRAAWDANMAVTRIMANLTKRINLGATVEQGALVVEDTEKRYESAADPIESSSNACGFSSMGITIYARKFATRIMGKPRRRKAA